MTEFYAFLRARLNEAEARARAVVPPGRPLEQGRYLTWVQTREYIADRSGYLIAHGVHSQAARDHIVHHDPASVLAKLEVDRRIIAEHDGREVASLDPETRGQTYTVCRRCTIDGRQVIAPCKTLRLLALPYASHPQWRTQWVTTTAP